MPDHGGHRDVHILSVDGSVAASTTECLLEVGTRHQASRTGQHQNVLQNENHGPSSGLRHVSPQGNDQQLRRVWLRTCVRKLPNVQAKRCHQAETRKPDHVCRSL